MEYEVSVLGFSTAEECGSLKILKNLEEFCSTEDLLNGNRSLYEEMSYRRA